MLKCIFILLVSVCFAGCVAKYTKIDSNSEKIELSCFDITLPWDASWYWVNYSAIKCENEAQFITGGGKDIYIIEFKSQSRGWNDKYSDEYLLEKGEKFIKTEEKSAYKIRGWEVENLNLDYKIVDDCVDICMVVTTSLTFKPSKPVYYKFRSQTGEEIEFQLDESEKYDFVSIEYSVINGPYKYFFGKVALTYQIKLIRKSVQNFADPELEAKAQKILETLEITLDKEKIDLESEAETN